MLPVVLQREAEAGHPNTPCDLANHPTGNYIKAASLMNREFTLILALSVGVRLGMLCEFASLNVHRGERFFIASKLITSRTGQVKMSCCASPAANGKAQPDLMSLGCICQYVIFRSCVGHCECWSIKTNAFILQGWRPLTSSRKLRMFYSGTTRLNNDIGGLELRLFLPERHSFTRLPD